MVCLKLHAQIVSSTKNDGFSLSSGDFPTLGSERDNSGKNSESQGNFACLLYVDSKLSDVPIMMLMYCLIGPLQWLNYCYY